MNEKKLLTKKGGTRCDTTTYQPDERSMELHPYSPGPCTSLSLGGWLPILDLPIFKKILGSIWFSINVILFLFLYIWVRAAFPRYRYDQLMGLGRKELNNVTSTSVSIEAGSQYIEYKIREPLETLKKGPLLVVAGVGVPLDPFDEIEARGIDRNPIALQVPASPGIDYRSLTFFFAYPKMRKNLRMVGNSRMYKFLARKKVCWLECCYYSSILPLLS
ncbi:nadh-ubiquinone oxidoreductase chain 1 [Quercus suber]|uniref:Nadh-ubiquinone oxidoreductase chain 1 n=1 Tax=Quercus suber TaxID=58331 RepID=A0AAW0KYN2_QUESU